MRKGFRRVERNARETCRRCTGGRELKGKDRACTLGVRDALAGRAGMEAGRLTLKVDAPRYSPGGVAPFAFRPGGRPLPREAAAATDKTEALAVSLRTHHAPVIGNSGPPLAPFPGLPPSSW